MRTITYTENNQHKLGILVGSKVYNAQDAADLMKVKGDFSSLRKVLEVEQNLDKLKEIASKVTLSTLSFLNFNEVELQAPIMNPPKVLGAALNYYDFCMRGNLPVPEKLKVFGKWAKAVNRPSGNIDIQGRNVTYEGELGIVIAKDCKNTTLSNAMDYVAGYTIVNDLTANDYVKEDVQLMRGKNLDGFLPMGPIFVTKDELPDAGKLKLQTKVDDEVLQNSSTDQLIFGIDALVCFFSSFMTLESGDVIASGTPAGTALQFNPPRFLKPGQTVRITIEKIGTLENTVTTSV